METFQGLNVSAEKQSVLLTEATLVSKSDREKMTEIMFETFSTPSIFLADQSILSLYACGLMDGVVVQSGYGLTQVVTSNKGNPVPNTSCKLNLAGQKLDEYLSKLLEEQNLKALGSDTIKDIKEKLCYVALDYDAEMQKGDSVKQVYKLPDGQEVGIGQPRFTCPEALFRPSLVKNSSPGFSSLINEAISKCSSETGVDASTFYKNIVIAGGCSMFPGMANRVEKEMKSLAPSGTPVSVTAGIGGTASSFIGGSILTCLESMNPLWITRKMYDESGSSIVHAKCV